MRRLTVGITLALALTAASPPARAASTLCVGGKPACFPSLQAAVAAARDGDTILIAPGTYAGGVTIGVSVTLTGAGANRTTISGGGPVLTIGVARQFPPDEPTVAIRGVTITGGVTHSSFLGDWFAAGGGIEIPPSCTTGPECPSFEYGPGATVAISHSVVTGNEAVPTGSIGLGSFAAGGGIDNAGALTLTSSVVSDNQSGAPASPTVGALAGGIKNFGAGTLTLTDSAVTRNRAIVADPSGVFAQGGGIDTEAPVTIERSVISGNTVSAGGGGGEVVASAGGIDVEESGSLTLTWSTVDHNRATAVAPAGVGGLLIANSGGIGVDGTATIADSSIRANGVAAQAPDGIVAAAGGGLLADSFGGVTVRRSLIAQNSIGATSPGGSVFAQGGGVANFGLMTIERTLVIANNGAVNGPGGLVQGGGIWNSNFDGGPPTTPQLTLTDSTVTANRLSGLAPQGGGLYTTFPATITRTAINGNTPDQCAGC